VGSSLKEYKQKRDFSRTDEPAGDRAASSDALRFVVQEHAASSHHFDLRLEVDGVLKSWAVPKGPSTDPREKRLAMPTEDHPLEYADFEGVIPEGEYGAGVVIVWDRGPYQNLRAQKDGDGVSMSQALEEGKLEVSLQGEKISGGYALIRTGGGDGARWLLIKMKDDGADARRNPTSTERRSVLSGLTLDELAERQQTEAENGKRENGGS
jgi:DNA ligase D-like protein (predicted 3'-phosphoesterase)